MDRLSVRCHWVPIAVERDTHGRVVEEKVAGRSQGRLAWPRGHGPPYDRGLYLWTSASTGRGVLYVGKATSRTTSHLYRRLTSYKHPGGSSTQETSIRINGEALCFARGGGEIAILCLVASRATPAQLAAAEFRLITRGRPPWNRLNNPRPRSVDNALPVLRLLDQRSLDTGTVFELEV